MRGDGEGSARLRFRLPFPRLVPLLLCLLVLSGCSLPRFIILDDPLTPEEHINLGVAYERSGKLENAIKEYELASKRMPVAYLYLGNAYQQLNRPREAEKYYRKSIKKAPAAADAYNNLAWLFYTGRDRLHEAEALALKAVELDPAREDYRDTLNKIRELRAKNGL